jgi:hypothetical protein
MKLLAASKLWAAECPWKIGQRVGVGLIAGEDGVCELQRLDGARAILATAPSGDGIGPLPSGLAAHGKLIKWLGRFQVVRRQLVIYSNSSTTISGFDPSRRGGPHVPAPLEVKTCMFPIRLKPYTNCR